MEPIGVSASILTLLNAAGESCKFLYNLYIDLEGAPEEIRAQAIKLQCLNLAVHQLVESYKKLPKEFEVDPRVADEVKQFEGQVTSMQRKIQRKSTKVSQGRRQRAWQSCKWLLFDRQMNRFLQSVDHWSIIINQAAIAAQMYGKLQLEILVS